MGARTDRWSPNWEGRSRGSVRATNALWSTLGLFFLWFGWLGFNVGSVGSISNGKGFFTGVIAQNTTLFGAGAGMVAVTLQKLFKKNWDLEVFINSLLAGLVASTGGAGLMQSWAAFVCGGLFHLSRFVGLTFCLVVAGLVYYGSRSLFDFLKLDDALDAVPIHFFCGWWSTIAVGLFATQEYMSKYYGINDRWGLFLGVCHNSASFQFSELISSF
jgi:Amt family ammonium transporter